MKTSPNKSCSIEDPPSIEKSSCREATHQNTLPVDHPRKHID
jgi:hypothetical protein